MASERKTSILLVSVLFLQSLYQTKSSPAIPLLVKKQCADTYNPTFCMKTLASDPRTLKAKNATEITEIFLSIGMNDASKSRDYINGLAKGKGLKPKDKAAIEDCANEYNYISLNFKSALGEVEEGDFLTANYDIMVSFDDVHYCQNSMAEAKLHVPEIDSRLNVTVDFINIAFKFTNV